MGRRRFDHFHAEFSVETETALDRYPLWLALHELGLDPEAASTQDLLDFVDFRASSWLWEELGLRLTERQWRRVRKRIQRFDPEQRRPEDLLDAFAG